jgi:hypothetical protein
MARDAARGQDVVSTTEVKEEVDRIARGEEQKGKEKRQIVAAAAEFLSQGGR